MALTYVICDLTIFFTIQDFDRILFKPSNATWKLWWIPWHVPLLHIKNSLSLSLSLSLSSANWLYIVLKGLEKGPRIICSKWDVMPHQLWHRTSGFEVSDEGPPQVCRLNDQRGILRIYLRDVYIHLAV